MSDQQGFAGQQSLTDDTSQFNAICFVVRQLIGRINTMKVVKVVAVYGGGAAAGPPTVDVLPLVSQIDGLGNGTPHAVVFDLPCMRWQGGGNAIILDPQVDDIGYAVIADRDISAVKASKKESTPASFRRFSLSDGVYCGGILNGVPEQSIAFTGDGITLSDKNGNVLQMKAGGLFLNTSLFVEGEVVRGQGTGDRVTLGHHLHTSGGSGSPTSVPTPGT